MILFKKRYSKKLQQHHQLKTFYDQAIDFGIKQD